MDYPQYFYDYDMEDMALFVKYDLGELGYDDVYYTNIRSANPGLNEVLICIRTGWDDWGNPDYHFMKYAFDEIEEEWAWFHKPGSMAILKYLSEPSNNIPAILTLAESRAIILAQ